MAKSKKYSGRGNAICSAIAQIAFIGSLICALIAVYNENYIISGAMIILSGFFYLTSVVWFIIDALEKQNYLIEKIQEKMGRAKKEK